MSRLRTLLVFLAVFMVAFAITLLVATRADGHTGYCGHGSYTFEVALPNGFVTHRETFLNGHGSGPHYHNYSTRRLASNPWRWVFIHYHYGRQCPSHAVK